MGRMLEEAVRYARAQDLLHPGMHVLVACSGGPDSLALLDMLLQLRRRFRLVDGDMVLLGEGVLRLLLCWIWWCCCCWSCDCCC